MKCDYAVEPFRVLFRKGRFAGKEGRVVGINNGAAGLMCVVEFPISEEGPRACHAIPEDFLVMDIEPAEAKARIDKALEDFLKTAKAEVVSA